VYSVQCIHICSYVLDICRVLKKHS